MVIEEIRSMASEIVAPEIMPIENQAQRAAQATAKETVAQQVEEQVQEEVSRDTLEEAIGSMNKAISLLNHRLKFSIDDTTGRLTARVIDSKTNEVVKEVPPERVLDFVRRFKEFLGLLVDEKA